MMVWSINLLILSIGLLIVGMIKPGLILFWMETPKRMPIFMVSVVIFMSAAMMFGEANMEKQTETTQEPEIKDTPSVQTTE